MTRNGRVTAYRGRVRVGAFAFMAMAQAENNFRGTAELGQLFAYGYP